MKTLGVVKFILSILLLQVVLSVLATCDTISGTAYTRRDGTFGVDVHTPYGEINQGNSGIFNYLNFDPNTLQYSLSFYSETGPQDYCGVYTNLCSAAWTSATLTGTLPSGLVQDQFGNYRLSAEFTVLGTVRVEYYYDYLQNPPGYHDIQFLPATFDVEVDEFYSPSVLDQTSLNARAGTTATFPQTPEPGTIIMVVTGLAACGGSIKRHLSRPHR